MESLIIQKTDLLITSREIAELTGKQHRSVLRDIDKLNESYENLGLHKIVQGSYTLPSTGNQQHREMMLTQIQCTDLMSGYKTELRIKINRRWEQLEKEKQAGPNIESISKIDLARLVIESEQEKERLLIENERLQTRTQFVDVVFNSDDLLTGSQVCKILGLTYGNVTLYRKLRELGIFFKNRNEPKQTLVDRGYFRMKELVIGERVKLQTLITQKGLGYIAQQLQVLKPETKTIKILN